MERHGGFSAPKARLKTCLSKAPTCAPMQTQAALNRCTATLELSRKLRAFGICMILVSSLYCRLIVPPGVAHFPNSGRLWRVCAKRPPYEPLDEQACTSVVHHACIVPATWGCELSDAHAGRQPPVMQHSQSTHTCDTS